MLSKCPAFPTNALFISMWSKAMITLEIPLDIGMISWNKDCRVHARRKEIAEHFVRRHGYVQREGQRSTMM